MGATQHKRRDGTGDQDQPVLLCYCPAAVRELQSAREELIRARTLQARDPDYDAREALKQAAHELGEARELLQGVLAARELLQDLRQIPRLCVEARTALESAQGVAAVAKLGRVDALMPKVERIEKLMDRLENTEIRVVYADA